MFVDPLGLRNVAAIVGSDVSSNDNVFKSDIETFKDDNKNDNIKVYYAWEYESWDEIKSAISDDFGNEKIDALVIAAHSSVDEIILSNDYKRPGRPNIYIKSNTSWRGLKFSKDANIRIMGCNAGGMAGQANKKAVMNLDENGDFVSYSGELVDVKSIAQVIANKTGVTVWAFTNYSSQKEINGGYYQVAVDRYGESLMSFSYTSGHFWWKETTTINGNVNSNYTKFTK